MTLGFAEPTCLSAVAYPVAALCATSAFAPLLTVPMLALLAYFAHERTQRLEHLIELNETYRGTALLLGEVIGADDAYTARTCQDVVRLAVAVAEQLGLTADRKRNIAVRGSAARRRKDRRSQGNHQQARQAHR